MNKKIYQNKYYTLPFFRLIKIKCVIFYYDSNFYFAEILRAENILPQKFPFLPKLQ